MNDGQYLERIDKINPEFLPNMANSWDELGKFLYDSGMRVYDDLPGQRVEIHKKDCVINLSDIEAVNFITEAQQIWCIFGTVKLKYIMACMAYPYFLDRVKELEVV